MGGSKILAWVAVLATAAVIASGEIVSAFSEHAASGCADQGSLLEEVAGSILGGLFWALPWLLTLGAQLVRLRYPATALTAVVSVVWILFAGFFASAIASDWPGTAVTHECLYDDSDNLDTDFLVSWLLAWPCAIFFWASVAFAWERNSRRGKGPSS
jgi:hypothetical protein